MDIANLILFYLEGDSLEFYLKMAEKEQCEIDMIELRLLHILSLTEWSSLRNWLIYSKKTRTDYENGLHK